MHYLLAKLQSILEKIGKVKFFANQQMLCFGNEFYNEFTAQSVQIIVFLKNNWLVYYTDSPSPIQDILK